MMKKLAFALGLFATPAMAAEGAFLSLHNPEFVVIVGFVLFVGLILYLKVPGLLGRMLDQRAETIRKELDEARALREEAQTVLASYERKQAEVQEQAARIVEHARSEAEEAAARAREDLKESIARRMAAAEEQIASARAGAVKEVRDTAVQVAVAAAREVVASKMSAQAGNKLIDEAIAAVEEKLH